MPWIALRAVSQAAKGRLSKTCTQWLLHMASSVATIRWKGRIINENDIASSIFFGLFD